MSRKLRYINTFRQFWQAGADLLFPPRCRTCDDSKGPFLVPTLCWSCWQGLYQPMRLPLRTWSGGRYDGNLKTLIGAAKFQADPLALSPLLHLTETLVREYVRDPLPNVLLSMPGSPKRIRQRGIHLPDRLARHLRRKLRIPYEKAYLKRIRDTPSQQGLSHSARKKNLQGCFRASPGLRGHHVLLIDDVSTTGATLEEAVNALRVHKPVSITCLVLAKTL